MCLLTNYELIVLSFRITLISLFERLLFLKIWNGFHQTDSSVITIHSILVTFLRHIIFIIFIIKFHHITSLNLSSTSDIETRGRISLIKSYTVYHMTERILSLMIISGEFQYRYLSLNSKCS